MAKLIIKEKKKNHITGLFYSTIDFVYSCMLELYFLNLILLILLILLLLVKYTFIML